MSSTRIAATATPTWGRLARRLTGVGLSVALAGTLITATPSRGASSIELIGTFTPTTTNPNYVPIDGLPYASVARLTVDESGRVLYTVDNLNPGFVAAYDLDTLAPIGAGLHVTTGARHAVAVLEDVGWLVVASGSGGTTNIEVLHTTPKGVESIGAVSVGAQGLGGPEHEVAGLAPVPGTRSVFALTTSAANDSGGTTALSLIDLDEVAEGAGAVRWTQPVPNCLLPARVQGMPAAVGWVNETASVYFACSDASTIIFDSTYKAPMPAGIGRLRVEGIDGPPREWTPGPFELYPRAGDFRGWMAVFDPTTKRILASAGGAAAGGTLYAFDTLHGAYVGGLTVGPNNLSSIGIGSSGGRVYARSPNPKYGLLAADVATTPLEQGRALGQFAGAIGGDGSGSGQIEILAVDSVTSRVFMPPTTHPDGSLGWTPHWFVLQDNVPAYTAPAMADPDRNTIDMPEAPGVTGRTFGAAAQGYGFRTRQVGGTKGLQFNVVPFDASTDAVVSGGTREGRTAYLERITLTDGEAAADVISSDRDDGATGADQARTSTEWPIESAQCVDFGDGATEDAADGSAVTCDFSAPSVEAITRAGRSDANGVGVDASSLQASVRLDADEGIVVEVTAAAEGIGAPGLLSIGRVAVTTTATAHGRPGTAVGSFDRTVEDVRIAGQVVCTTDCDLEQIKAVFNEQFAGRARLDFPMPDERLAQGSPGGYQTIVQRGREQQVQAIFEDQQEANRVEVPGMVLYLYQDNTVPAHTIYEFAGTQAEARYGIFALTRTDDPHEPDEPEAPVPPGTGGEQDNAERSTSPLDAPLAGSAEIPELPGAGDRGDPRPTASGGLVSVVEEILSLALNDPRMLVSLLPVWVLLLAPVYLSARRALYVRRERLIQGEPA